MHRTSHKHELESKVPFSKGANGPISPKNKNLTKHSSVTLKIVLDDAPRRSHHCTNLVRDQFGMLGDCCSARSLCHDDLMQVRQTGKARR